jgi:hypothetical protein
MIRLSLREITETLASLPGDCFFLKVLPYLDNKLLTIVKQLCAVVKEFTPSDLADLDSTSERSQRFG